MAEKYQVFDAARQDFETGINLIEASAGTGKTYAIGMLVLRSVVELGVPVDKILIVTFTKAATDELKSRIRSRLVEARNLLSSSQGEFPENTDKTLRTWGERVKDKQKAVERLQYALYDIDRAAIFTIHGYCQRMLVEQALESNQLFEVELSTGVDRIRSEVVEDFWRNHLYRMDPLACGVITTSFPTPQALFSSVSLAKTGISSLEPEIASVESGVRELLEGMEAMKRWWQTNGDSLHIRFIRAIEENHFKKRVYEDFSLWFSEIEAYFSGTTYLLPDKLGLLAEEELKAELNGTKFRGDEKRSQYLKGWNLPGSKLERFSNGAENLVLTIRVKLARELCREVSKRLLQKGLMGFDDLIHNLSSALRGPRRASLQKTLSDRYEVALIDEFQDTDSEQYHIFSTLFGRGKHHLYLIGDPKQAIYKFRGADIQSYFQAKRAADRLLTLEKNYRSHPGLVQEVNRLFGSRQSPFYYQDDVLAYNQVRPAKTGIELNLLKDGRQIAGMVYCSLPANQQSSDGRWSGGRAKETIRDYIVEEIKDLLYAPPTIIDSDEQRQTAPKDIAILVRKNREAEEYRNSLATAGIPAVVRSRISVFHTAECRDLLLLLRCISCPSEIIQVKTAMTISWFGFTGDELHKLWEDEGTLSLWQAKMAEYRAMWQQENFLTMMNRLLVFEEVFVTIAGDPLAERTIANIYQLLELTQEQESTENLGISQTLGWLTRMHLDDKPMDEGELLLESDEEAVQIVTMHSAKGLEYPVVFCPVLWSASDFLAAETWQVRNHDSEGGILIDLGSQSFAQRKEEAVGEQSAEDIRLLYVALTRAKLRCYTVWADVKKRGSSMDAFDSALGYLLFPNGCCPSSVQEELFLGLAAQSNIEYRVISTLERQGSYIRNQGNESLSARSGKGRTLQTDWQMSSFSAMAAQSEHSHEGGNVDPGRAGSGDETPIDVIGLPAGPNFGNVVHDLLEEQSFSAIPTDEGFSEACEKTYKRYGITAETEGLVRLLCNVVGTALPAGFTLSELDDGKCLKEMEFYFRLSPLATSEINAVLAGEETVQPLSYRTMQGYLTGFVDLICEAGGKYYIFDYKTNYLGDRMDDYRPENLVSAMADHNYGLQYWIYTLVLHRHLKNLLSSYDYSSHFGGVMYLFVRGMSPGWPGYGVYSAMPDERILGELDRVIGGTEHG